MTQTARSHPVTIAIPVPQLPLTRKEVSNPMGTQVCSRNTSLGKHLYHFSLSLSVSLSLFPLSPGETPCAGDVTLERPVGRQEEASGTHGEPIK